jgi:hypothetical protein
MVDGKTKIPAKHDTIARYAITLEDRFVSNRCTPNPDPKANGITVARYPATASGFPNDPTTLKYRLEYQGFRSYNCRIQNSDCARPPNMKAATIILIPSPECWDSSILRIHSKTKRRAVSRVNSNKRLLSQLVSGVVNHRMQLYSQ